MLKPVRSRMRTAHPHIIKGQDSAGAAERDRLPAFDKIGPSKSRYRRQYCRDVAGAKELDSAQNRFSDYLIRALYRTY